MRSGDVEQHNLIRTAARMAHGELGGVARVDDVHELHALHDAASAHVKASDDSLR